MSVPHKHYKPFVPVRVTADVQPGLNFLAPAFIDQLYKSLDKRLIHSMHHIATKVRPETELPRNPIRKQYVDLLRTTHNDVSWECFTKDDDLVPFSHVNTMLNKISKVLSMTTFHLIF